MRFTKTILIDMPDSKQETEREEILADIDRRVNEAISYGGYGSKRVVVTIKDMQRPKLGF